MRETQVMEKILLFGFLNTLWITGFWHAFRPGEIFGKIGDLLEGDPRAIPVPEKGLTPNYLNKPFFVCPKCMASIHGTFWWFLFDMGPWYLLPFYVVCLSGLMVWVTVLILSKDS